MYKTMYMKQITAIGILSTLLLPMGAAAQTQHNDTTLRRTVVVEHTYNADILDARKINVLPAVEPLKATHHEVVYDQSLRPAREIPADTLHPFAGAEKQLRVLPGYVRAGYGNNGNLDLAAAYRLQLSDRDALAIDFGLQGMKYDSIHAYRTRVALDYWHRFNRFDFRTAAQFGLNNFSRLPYYGIHNQKYVSGDLHIGANSKGFGATSNGLAASSQQDGLQWQAETNLMLYQRYFIGNQNNTLTAQFIPGRITATEALVRTRGEALLPLDEQSRAGLRLAMDNLFYKKLPWEDVTSLDLNPYYEYHTDALLLRAGAHVGLAFGSGKAFRVAPDLYAGYTFSGSHQLYVQARGGRLQNDFRRLESLNPYGEFDLMPRQLDATYESLNASIGYKASPTDNLWLHLFAGYQMLDNDLCIQSDGTPANQTFLPTWENTDTRNVYVGAEAGYAYRQLFKFSASATYRNWKEQGLDEEQKSLSEHLYYKPELQADVHVDICPITPLTVTVGYQHESRTGLDDSNVTFIESTPASISNLYAQAQYAFLNRLTVYTRMGNLLNKSYQIYPFYPAQGFHFIGGVSLRF